ncbi:MAG TPA: MBL fold metallo-hydrolase [Allosphingosinicella sp.]|nr:MBL fold metallo-hydrolase [Allosphingosinicella sp.]
MPKLLLVLGMISSLAAAPARAEALQTAAPRMSFVTLGTQAGPEPSPTRSQPSNLVRLGSTNVLVDVGEGAVAQLTKAGVGLGEVQAVAISHLHFDHIGGLFGFLSLRYQARLDGPLTIYGPPGTRVMVERLLAAMQPGAETMASVRGGGAPGDSPIRIVEIDRRGARFDIGGIAVTAAENSHFHIIADVPAGSRPVSLAFRFDAAGRSIVYTGDTGPSTGVERLCAGADILVSEMMDPVATIARLRRERPGMAPELLARAEVHFRRAHLAPEEVGRLARRCRAKMVVVTHTDVERAALPAARDAIAREYDGIVLVAEDLQEF